MDYHGTTDTYIETNQNIYVMINLVSIQKVNV